LVAAVRRAVARDICDVLRLAREGVFFGFRLMPGELFFDR
jgi:hypothetical protein